MWLLAGGIAIIVVIVSIMLVLIGKHKYCTTLVFISLSSGLFVMLSQYDLVNGWVQAGDMSALMDVVPAMNNVLIIAVSMGVILNAIAEFANWQALKK